MTVNEVVNAQGLTKGLAHTEHSVRGAVPFTLQRGLRKGHSRQREFPVQRARCRGMKQEGALEWLEMAVPLGMAGKESGAQAGPTPEHVYIGPGAGI